MGSLVNGIKKFVGNKNTVTILAVIAGIIVLWYFYTYRVNQAITTIKVPYSVKGVDANKKIETDSESIKYKELNKTVLKDNNDIVTNVSELNGKYVCKRTSIPANGFFYKSQLCDVQELPSSIWNEIPENKSIYTLSVNSLTTYADSLMPGDHIDLYMSAVDDEGKIIYGKLIENIEILRVRDSQNGDIPWDSTAGASAYLLFAVEEEFLTILKSSNLVKGYSISVFPVARGGSYSQGTGDAEVSSQFLKKFIMSNVETHGKIDENETD